METQIGTYNNGGLTTLKNKPTSDLQVKHKLENKFEERKKEKKRRND